MQLSSLIARYYFVEHTMNVLSFLFGGLVVFTLLCHSPPSFGRFKYLMINVTVAEWVYMIFAYWIFQPVPLFPAYSGVCLGPIRHFGPSACYHSFALFIFLFGYSIASLTLCFVYRYSLVAPAQISRFLSRTDVLAVLFVGMLLFVCVPIGLLWLTEEDAAVVRRELSVTRTEWRTEIDTFVFFGARSSIFVYLFMAALIALLVGNTLISIFFSLLIHHELNAHKRVMSKATYSMHRTLINILLAQTIIPIAFILLPIVLVVYLVITNEINDALMHAAHAPLAIYPFINDLLFLGFSAPHRRALLRLARKAVGAKEVAEVQTVATASWATGRSFRSATITAF